MNTKIFLFDTRTNMGTVDRYIRFMIGAGLIAVPLLYSGVDAEYAALTSLIAIPIIFTAIARWCPVYALLRAHSIRRSTGNTEFHSQNLSISDAVTRYLLGAILILVTMLYTSVGDPWLIVLSLIAVPIIHSAIMLWDPIYALLDIGTHRQPVNALNGVAQIIPLQSKGNETHPKLPDGGSKKAA